MTKQETLERLCALVTEVAEKTFGSGEVPHDCFCGMNTFSSHWYSMDRRLIEFIENAVREKLR